MSKEQGATVITYIVGFTTRDEPDRVQIFQSPDGVIRTLLDANTAKMQCWLNPDVQTCWTERLEQRRIGEILDRAKRSIIS